MDEQEWVTVHVGPPWEVELHGGRLRDAGIAVHLPDRTTKIVDPFITGPNPLEARLQVPPEDADRAREVLREARRAGIVVPDGADEEPDARDEFEPTPGEEVEALATRTLWTFFLFPPLGILFGLLYLLAARDLGVRSRRHGGSVAAFVLAFVALGGWVGAGLWLAHRPADAPLEHGVPPPPPHRVPPPPLMPGAR